MSTSSTDNNNNQSVYHEQYAPPWRPLLAIVFPLLPIFWTYRVDVTDTKLAFGYSYAYSLFDRADVLAAEAVERVNGLTQWGGWGIRYNLKWETGYIAKNGPAVRIEVKKNEEGGGDDAKVYVFSCDQAAKVCGILNGKEE